MRPDLDIASTLLRSRLVAIVRSAAPVDLVEACRSLFAGGVRCVEITLTTPGALGAIERVRADLPAGCVIGAGTVLDQATAEQALAAGAQFIVTPITDVPTIGFVRARGTAVLAGALTPTEMFQATRAGATMVKLFPATRLTPEYVRDVLAPLPELRVCPTGGVTLETVGAWFAAGAAAVAVGGGLLPRDALTAGRWDEIAELAQLWSAIVTPPTATPAVGAAG